MSKPIRAPIPRLIALVLLTSVLGACATGPREGPPAPVISVSPREPAPEAAPEPVVKAAPKPKPAAPQKQQTRTYAYREPGTEPEPEAAPETTPPPPGAQVPAGATPPPRKPAPVAQRTPTPAAPAAEPKAAPKPVAPPPKTGGQAVSAKPPATPPTPEPETRVASAAPASPPRAAPPPPPAPVDKPLTPTLPPAADGLARQAEQQRQQGDYAGAAATLERSLRIAPREAYLWNRLARVRMEQGLAAQAGQLAHRSNDLAGGQSNIKRDNWRIIAESRRRAGDMAGASEADQRAGGG